MIQTPEQSSKALQRAQKQLLEAQEQHKAALVNLRRLRANFNDSNSGMFDKDTEQGQRVMKHLREIQAKIPGAIEARDKARDALEVASDAVKRAEAEAVKQVCAEHAPEFAKHLRQFALSKLQRLEPEIVAAHHAVEQRYQVGAALGVRRQGRMGSLYAPAFDMLKDAEQFIQLKQETQELIERGILKAADIPADLRKVWSV